MEVNKIEASRISKKGRNKQQKNGRDGKMYFCIDEESREIVDQNGFRFSVEAFHKIRERYEMQRKPMDMTLSCQRLIQMNYDWDALKQFYDEN